MKPMLVVIDLNMPDDDRMSQVKIIRGVEFSREGPRNSRSPDAEFVTPWPLSDSCFLASHKGEAVVLVDVFGNMELLSAAGGQGPRPLRPRRKPPVIPAGTAQAEVRKNVSCALLAKPVLEKTCILCHREEKAKPQSSKYRQLGPYALNCQLPLTGS